jgi:very-short-patch-repair endonuclease
MSNKPKRKSEFVDQSEDVRNKKQTIMEPSEVLNNYINQITNEECNVYEIDSKIQWDDLISFRETSECKEFNIIMNKFERSYKKYYFPRGFWDNEVSHKLYMLILRVKLGFYTMESLYKISKNDLKKNYGGGGFFKKYNDSPNLILSSLYPRHENLRMFSAFKGKRPNGIPTVEYWHNDNPKKPHEVFMNSHTKYKFNCDACPHPFNSSLDHIVIGRWCPYCANKELCENSLSCPTCLSKSFLSFKEKRPNGILTVEYWHEDNPKKPHEVFMNSAKKYKFKCDSCPHNFDSRLDDIVSGGNWCPYCANPPKKLCKNSLTCPTCLPKTFCSFDGKTSSGKLKVQCWSKTNVKQPHEVFMNSNTKYKFNCDACPHSFDSSLANIVSGGNWCPTCKNKTEKLVLEFLQTLFSKKDVKHQFKHEKVKNILFLPFDICILPHQIIIEVDGMQHFHNVSHFRSHAVEQCERDCNKMKIIFEEGYSIIRIVQEDIWLSKTRDEVLTKLEKAIQECIHHELPMIHYITMDDSMYDNHKRIISESSYSSSTSSSSLQNSC